MNNGQFSVVHKMWKLGLWQMCNNKKITTKLAMHIVCSRCRGIMEILVDLIEL